MLAGCGILPKKEPLSIYAPEARVQPDAAWPSVRWQLQVPRPHASELLDSPRIVVRPADGELQVYHGAIWAAARPGPRAGRGAARLRGQRAHRGRRASRRRHLRRLRTGARPAPIRIRLRGRRDAVRRRADRREAHREPHQHRRRLAHAATDRAGHQHGDRRRLARVRWRAVGDGAGRWSDGRWRKARSTNAANPVKTTGR